MLLPLLHYPWVSQMLMGMHAKTSFCCNLEELLQHVCSKVMSDLSQAFFQ